MAVAGVVIVVIRIGEEVGEECVRVGVVHELLLMTGLVG